MGLLELVEHRTETRVIGAGPASLVAGACFLINAPNEDVPAAIPRLIDAAVASFDADRDTSRRYLLLASALLRAKREARTDASGAWRSGPRGGLLTWQLNCVVDYIESHLADELTVKAVADLINVSVGHLSRAFRISVGVPPIHYIGRRRVELACTLMRTTRVPLSQIAVACGLYDQAHLCKVFRRMTGMTPSAWRRASAEDSALAVRVDCVVGAPVVQERIHA